MKHGAIMTQNIIFFNCTSVLHTGLYPLRLCRAQRTPQRLCCGVPVFLLCFLCLRHDQSSPRFLESMRRYTTTPISAASASTPIIIKNMICVLLPLS